MQQRVFFFQGWGGGQRCSLRGLIPNSINKIWKHMSKKKKELVTFQIVATANEAIWIALLKHFWSFVEWRGQPGCRVSNPALVRGMSLTSSQFHRICSFNCDSVSNNQSLQYLIPAASSLNCLLLSLSSFLLHFEHSSFLSFVLPDKFETRQPNC
jgi:hypothetical protein